MKFEAYECSSAQKRLFMLRELSGNTTLYNLTRAMIIEGKFELARFEQAFAILIERHEGLRTAFEFRNGEVLQKVYQEVDFAIKYSEAPGREVEELINQFIQPFDLEKPPLLRVELVKLEDERHLFLFDMDHIITDGVSVGILTQELISLYSGQQLPEIEVQYVDFVMWQNDLLNSPEIKAQEEYWLNVFREEVPVLTLPYDYPRPPQKNYAGSNLRFALSEELSSEVRKLAAKNGATLFMTLMAFYTIILAKYSRQEDIVIGTPIAGRHISELKHTIGIFINTLAMRNFPGGQKTFNEFLHEVKDNALQAYKNQDYQFEMLVDHLQLERDMSRNPLFDAMFVFQNTDNYEIAVSGLKFTPYHFAMKTAKFDLTIEGHDRNNRLEFNLQYLTSLFKSETMERFREHFVNLIAAVVKNPESRIADLEIMSPEERAQVVSGWNDTRRAFPDQTTVHRIFSEQAFRRPEATALFFDGQEMSYRALNAQVNRLAHLLRERGVGPDTVVGLMVERSFEMMCGLLAIMKAGGAFLPLDPKYPVERIEYILQDSQARFLLTDVRYTERARFDGQVLTFTEPALVTCPETEIAESNAPTDLAYIIYTSGSTGKPKGVAVEHRSVINTVNHLQQTYLLNANDVVLQSTVFTFDASIREIFWWFFAGASCSLLAPDGEKDPALVIDTIYRDKVTYVKFVPSLLNEVLNWALIAGRERLASLRYIFCGGEALPQKTVDEYFAIFKQSGPRFVNMYGPTEASLHCTEFPINGRVERPIVPIGRPISNMRIYVLDGALKPLPVGVMGEIYIAGVGVAREYRNNPELTAERFLNDPFVPGERMYRSGDQGAWLADGNVQFFGRNDHQIKIRGFRIEAGEIESQLLKHAQIKEAVVIDREDRAGTKYLAAFIVATEVLTQSELRNFLGNELPDYMIPATFVLLDKLPLLANGKVDRKALLAVEGEKAVEENYVAPTNELEETLARAWALILGVERVGIRDNFFALRGDSIKAIRIAARLQADQLKVELRHFFQHPTIETLAPFVKRLQKSAEQGLVTGEVELTPIQRRFFKTFPTDRHHYNNSVMLFNPQGFEENMLQAVFARIVEHHDALRLVFDEVGLDKGDLGGTLDKMLPPTIRQVNRGLAGELYTWKVIDLRGEVDVQETVVAEASKLQASMNLARGPLVKVGLFKTDAGDHLLIAIHHLVIDGISWRILLEDLAEGYRQAVEMEKSGAGVAISLPAKTTSYQDWAKALTEYAQSEAFFKEVEYWQNITQQAVKPLPRAGEMLADNWSDSKELRVEFSAEETQALLAEVHQAYNTEINDIFLSALALTLREWTGENQVAVALEGHGREEIVEGLDISRTVGWFTSIYPVVVQLAADKDDLGYNLKLVKETLRRVPNKGIGYGIYEYLTPEELKNPVDPGRQGLPVEKLHLACKLQPEVAFNYLGQFDQELAAGAGVFSLSDLGQGEELGGAIRRPYTFSVRALVRGGKLQVVLNYNRHAYAEATVSELLARFAIYVRQIIEHCRQVAVPEFTPSDLGFGDLSLEELEYAAEALDFLED